MWLAAAVLRGGAGGLPPAGTKPLYAFGGIIGLLVAFAIVLDTQVGLIAFLALAILLPFGVIPLPLGPVKLTFIDATLTLLLLVWLLRLLAKPGERLRTSRLDGFILAFVGLAAVSFTSGTSTAISPESARLFLKIINSILLFFTVLNCVRTLRHLREITAAFTVAGTLSAIIGIVLYVIPHETAVRLLSALRPLNYPSGWEVLRFIAGTDTLRATSTSIDPNVLGSTLMLCLAVTATQLLTPRPALPRWALAPMAGVMSLCLLLTLSRSSWVGLAAALLFISLMKYRRLWLVFALVGAALYIGLLPQADQYLGHLYSGVQCQAQAAAMRLGEYKDAVRLITRYPFFGVGFGEAPSIDLYVGVSSIYLLIAENMGLIGLTMFLLIMGVHFIHNLTSLRRIRDAALQDYLLGFLAALFAAMVAGLFDQHFFNLRFPHTVALFWSLVGLTMVASRLGTEHPSTELVPSHPPDQEVANAHRD